MLRHAAAQALAVLRQVVARDDGEGRAARAAAGVESDEQARERRARPGTVQVEPRGVEAASQRRRVGGDGGVVEVGGAVAPSAVADLGDRERDDRDGVIGEQLRSRRSTSAPSYAADDAVDDLDAVAVGGRVRRGSRARPAPASVRGGLRIAPGEGRDAPARRHRRRRAVYQAWWARWKAPRPRWTMRIGARARGLGADAGRERAAVEGDGGACGRVGHSLNTSRGMASTRSRAMRSRGAGG